MRPENFEERKKMFLTAGALASASVILLLLGYFFIRYQSAPAPDANRTMASGKPGKGTIQPAAVLALLSRHTSRLQQLDERFARFLTDSSGSADAAVEAAVKDIRDQEQTIGRILDSLELAGSEYTQLLGPFRSLLTGHQYMTRLSALGTMPENAMASGNTVPAPPDSTDKQLLRTRSALRLSNDRVATLESQQNETQQLLDQQEKNVQTLQEQVTNLRSGNEHLLLRLKETAKVTDIGGEEAPAAQTAALERKTARLSDDLSFAQVDCNLSRADARQVVYSARQRKDLLTDALTTLTELSKSSDAGVQKKARERIALLRSIAATVHD